MDQLALKVRDLEQENLKLKADLREKEKVNSNVMACRWLIF